MAWHQIYQITHILGGHRTVTVVLCIHIYDGIYKDDIAVLVMRNKAIQVDTKPAGRTESVALI